MIGLTRFRKRSESKKKHRRKRRSRSRVTQQQTPALIVDIQQPEVKVIWSLLGLILTTGQTILCFSYPRGPEPWFGIGIAALLVLIGVVTNSLPTPRPHPAFLPGILIVLAMPILRIITGAEFLKAFSEPFIYAITLIWMFAWFVRGRWAVGVSALMLILLIEYFLSVHLPGGSWDTTPLLSHTEGIISLLWQGGLKYRLLLLLVLVCLIALVSRARRERGRWAKQRFLRFMMNSSLSLGILGLAAATVFPRYVPVDAISLLGFSFGVSIAARQRLISEDPTRHPASQLTPIRGYIEEIVIGLETILRSITGGGSLSTGTPDDRRSRLIDSNSEIIYNPYGNKNPNWVPVVLHAHTNRWEGKFKPEVVVDHFTRLGAKSVILTDHNRITKTKNPYQNIDAYEQGWGSHNNHVLVVGAHKRIPDSHMFGGSVRDRSKNLKRLRGVSEFTVLAHPRNKGAWSSDDVVRHDYDALEIFNKSIDSYRRWDEALSSGLLVWATAGDDCHDIRSRHQTGKRFLLVDLGDMAPHPGEPADSQLVLEALKAGRFISVRHMSRNVTREIPHPNLPVVEEFSFDGSSLRIKFNKRIDTIKVYGPFRTKKATYTREEEVVVGPRENEGFVRIVAEHGPFLIVFNPIARVSGLEYGV